MWIVALAGGVVFGLGVGILYLALVDSADDGSDSEAGRY